MGTEHPPHPGCSGGVFPGQGRKYFFLPSFLPPTTLSPSSPSPAMVDSGSAAGILLFLTFLKAAEPEGGEETRSRLG